MRLSRYAWASWFGFQLSDSGYILVSKNFSDAADERLPDFGMPLDNFLYRDARTAQD